VKHTNQLDFFNAEDSYTEDKEGHTCIKCETYKETLEFPFRETI